MRARVLPLVVLLALLAAVPARAATPAEKTAYKVFIDYTKDGRIDPCDYTTTQLQTALDEVSPDQRQYASDYPAAIKQALRFRARGGCDPKDTAAAPAPTAAPAAPAPSASGAVTAPSTGTATLPAAPGEPPAPDTAVPPAASTASDSAVEQAAAASPDNGAPAPLIGLGLLAILAALAAAMLLTVRRLGQGEGRLAPTYHSWREARWRAGGVWADFRDWLSLGR